eukprot:358829-Chlamydomonas_euryale.AAC.9
MERPLVANRAETHTVDDAETAQTPTQTLSAGLSAVSLGGGAVPTQWHRLHGTAGFIAARAVSWRFPATRSNQLSRTHARFVVTTTTNPSAIHVLTAEYDGSSKGRRPHAQQTAALSAACIPARCDRSVIRPHQSPTASPLQLPRVPAAGAEGRAGC